MLAGTNPQGDIVEELNLVTDQFDDTQAGQWAALTAADIESARGVRLMFTDRAAAETSLNLAKSHYREVLDSKHAAKDTMLLRRAHFGLAQVYEAQGELDEAKKQYATVAESDKDRPWERPPKSVPTGSKRPPPRNGTTGSPIRNRRLAIWAPAPVRPAHPAPT